jgi:DNA-binding transcriptional ArsR family regulator
MLEIRTADRGDIRDVNLAAVIDVLRRHESVTRAHIARETGLSSPTVSAVVTTLLKAGLVTTVGSGPATGGRRGDLYELRADSRVVLAFDLSSAPPRRALVDLRGDIVGGSTADLPKSALRSPQAFVRWVTRHAASLDGLVGIGVAVPGVTDPTTGTIEWAPSLGWRDVKLRDDLQAAGAAAVVVDNDLNLASLGEHAFADERVSDLVMLGLRGGLGAGVILGGALHRGVHFAAGEIGYLPVMPGLRGSRDFGALEATLFDSLGHEDGPDIVELLSFACVAVAAVLDVALIVLGEEILQYGAQLPRELRERLADVLPHPPAVVFSKLGADGTLRGAAVAVQQEVTKDIRRLLA